MTYSYSNDQSLIVIYVVDCESYLMENPPVLAKMIDYICFVFDKLLKGGHFLSLRKLLDYCQSTTAVSMFIK
jgi:hypothetical protein